MKVLCIEAIQGSIKINTKSTVYNAHCTLYIIQYSLYTVQCTFYNVHYTLYSIHCAMYSMHTAPQLSNIIRMTRRLFTYSVTR